MEPPFGAVLSRSGTSSPSPGKVKQTSRSRIAPPIAATTGAYREDIGFSYDRDRAISIEAEEVSVGLKSEVGRRTYVR